MIRVCGCVACLLLRREWKTERRKDRLMEREREKELGELNWQWSELIQNWFIVSAILGRYVTVPIGQLWPLEQEMTWKYLSPLWLLTFDLSTEKWEEGIHTAEQRRRGGGWWILRWEYHWEASIPIRDSQTNPLGPSYSHECRFYACCVWCWKPEELLIRVHVY